MAKQLPKWATRVAAVILLAGNYVMHHAGIVPAGFAWHGINVMGVISDAMTALAAVGISGPTLWPQLAAALGNPSTTPPPPPAA